LIFTAEANGSQFDGFTVLFVDDPAVTVGSETVVYDTIAKTLTFHIDEGNTKAVDIVAALEADPVAGTDFRAEIDIRDAVEAAQAGTAVVSSASTGTTAGGSGVVLDDSGLRITNGGQTFDLDFAGAETVEDLLNVLNSSEASLLAEINGSGTGIDIRSRLSGADFSVGENGGTTATELGVRTFTSEVKLSELNDGIGFDSIAGTDFTIERNDGTLLDIDVSGAATVADVIDLINTAAGETIAQLATVGNGIELVDSSTSILGPGGQPVTINVTRPDSSLAAVHLGLVPDGATQSDTAVAKGGSQVLTGADVNPLEVDGLFNSLVRLHEALVDNDVIAIGRAIESFDENASHLDFARSEIGARQQSIDVVQQRLAFEHVELIEALSIEVDTDLAEAISELTARQFAYQASLQMSASILQISLLNFL